MEFSFVYNNNSKK